MQFADENRKDINDLRIFGYITYKQLSEAYIFNNNLVNNKHGLRPYEKNGVNQPRSIDNIDVEDLEGKIAEFAVYNALINRSINSTYPSLDAHGRGKSDQGYDLLADNHVSIDVKSSKSSAKALFLPVTKFKEDRNGNIKYGDNEIFTNLPDLFIMVNVGVDNLKGTKSAYKKFFVPKIYNLCKKKTKYNENKFVNRLHIYIEGILPQLVLISSIRQTMGLFRGISGCHKDDKQHAEYIPTVTKKWTLRYDNFVFPYFGVDLNNPYNSSRPYIHMMPPAYYL